MQTFTEYTHRYTHSQSVRQTDKYIHIQRHIDTDRQTHTDTQTTALSYFFFF